MHYQGYCMYNSTATQSLAFKCWKTILIWTVPSFKQITVYPPSPQRLFSCSRSPAHSSCRLDLLSAAQPHSTAKLCLLLTVPGECRGPAPRRANRQQGWGALGFTSSSLLQLISRNLISKLQVPSSWAVVKAACKPSSSMIEQLRFRSQTVPTSAIPRVSHVLAPQRSCKKKAVSLLIRSET